MNAPFQVPKDGKSIFEIDGIPFKIIEDKSSNSISSNQCYTIMVAKVETEHKLLTFLDKDSETGEISLSFSSKQIYHPQHPIGKFILKEGSTEAPLFLTCRLQGFDYGIDYFGNIEYRDGWIAFTGVIKERYMEDPTYSIKLYYPINVDVIDWKAYEFSLEEAMRYPNPTDIRYLQIDNPALFSKDILKFTSLKKLVMKGNYDYMDPQANYSSMNSISDGLVGLTKLKDLQIFNTCVDVIPTDVGKLDQLERLSFVNNKITEVPDSIFHLPNVKYIWLSNNKLKSLPNEINLPKIQSIHLDKNAFKTFPKSLVAQPLLESININSNPLEFLPIEFNDFKNLDLELESKKRLLNFEYPGANGKGTIKWDDKLYFSKNNQALDNQFRNAIKSTVLEKYQQELADLALSAVCMQTTEKDSYSKKGNTRFGGLPDLPIKGNYPTFWNKYEKCNSHYQFIAQLNCNELGPFQDYLPRNGMLYFYLEDQEDFKCQVIYHPDYDLQSAKDLNIDEEMVYDEGGIYAPFKVEFNKMIALPHFYFDDIWTKGKDIVALTSDGEDEEFYAIVKDEIAKKLGVNGIYRSWNDTFYPDDHHAINTYVFTQNEQPQEQSASELKGNHQDWVILLKVHSDNKPGFCFWDAGEICFMIHKSDLAKLDFSNVYCTLETS